jgi:hypothetical protein
VLRDVFEKPLGQLLFKNQLVEVLGFDPDEAVIVEWIP